MKKILFILVVTIIISSCATKETTFTVKFRDGKEMEILGIEARAGKNAFYVYHKDYQMSVFSKDDVLYIIKK